MDVMYYWRIRTKPPGGTDTYIKTNKKHIPDMIVDIAIKEKMFLDSFVCVIESVVEVTSEEYHEHMWD